MIVIAAALSLGVTAAYAAAGHSEGAAPRTHVGTSDVFESPAATTVSTSDDPVTHDQTDDRGQDQRPASEPSTAEDVADDGAEDIADDGAGDDDSGHDAQDDHSGSESHGGDD
jgi:hypothetical protein